MITKNLKQVVKFKTTPDVIYEILTDSKLHSKLTGAKANTGKPGKKFSHYEGDIIGENIEWVTDKKISQKWYCKSEGWPVGHFSDLLIKLKKISKGTELTLIQKSIPSKAYTDIKNGWTDFYWKPLKDMVKDM